MSQSITTQFVKLFAMVTYSVNNPAKVMKLTLWATLLMCAFLPFASIDVDPENMLAKDEPTRVFHNQMKQKMNINDMIAVGIESSTHPKGVFNPDSLNRIFEFSKYLQTLTWEEQDDELGTVKKGVVTHNILSPLQVDAIESGGKGVIKFDRLMKAPISTQEEADGVLARAMNNPFLAGTMISQDQKSLTLYIPITSKSVSSKLYAMMQDKVEEMNGPEVYHMTGLPLAEDVFGVDMFIQMAISAPMAMMLIFGLIYYFFRNAVIGMSALLVAMASVLITMGAFVAFGNTIHIMSSMISIFLMPIAVLDASHILSMFFDKYRDSGDRKKTIVEVMQSLFTPMLYTSLTSAAGFFSLYFAPIPPIQVFGIFVGLGILLAWFLSMTMVPAYILWIKPERLDNFGSDHKEESLSPLAKLVQALGQFAANHAKKLIAVFVICIGFSIVGIQSIKVNDNPMKWLAEEHPIRIADGFINDNFGGNYLAYLTLQPKKDESQFEAIKNQIIAAAKQTGDESVMQKVTDLVNTSNQAQGSGQLLDTVWRETSQQIARIAQGAAQEINENDDMESELGDIFADDAEQSEDDNGQQAWLAMQNQLSALRDANQVFKSPEILEYLLGLQAHMEAHPLVGKSNSLADLVKKLNKELHDADPAFENIPSTKGAVSETIVSFENSHEPFRVWHLVTQDFRTLNMWFQVKSGDNQDINLIVAEVEQYLIDNPAPIALDFQWFGLSYINTVWQKKMVSGMSDALISSMIVVMIIMVLLFRSIVWGLISMIPLSVTIAMIYGLIGLLGKDYDMPVAVLSALALGLAVDFAIHFISHAREYVRITGSWSTALSKVFNEPARAIYRNIIIIAVGFTPLLLAALVPYQTVGMLMASIMLMSGIATLIILPALLNIGQKWLFRD